MLKRKRKRKRKRVIYRGASVGFECETSKNHGKIDIERRPLVIVNQNLFDFGAGFTKTTNRVMHSISASKLFPESENPNFPGKMHRKPPREVRVSEIGEVGEERGGNAVMELEVHGHGLSETEIVRNG